MECPACKNKDDLILMDKHEEFNLYHCHKCDLQFWDPMKNPCPDWYKNDIYYSIRNFLIPETLDKKYNLFLDNPPVPEGKLLDIGCGTGMFAAYCKAKGYKVVAIDFNKDSVSVARDYWKLEEVHEMSFDEYKSRYPSQRFDIITFFEVLEHQERPELFIKNIKDSLVRGGYIALSLPNRDRWGMLPPMNDFPPNHLTKWNCNALINLLSSAGFSIIEIKELPFSIQSARQVLTGKLNNLKNRILTFAIKKVSTEGRSEKKMEPRKLFSILFFIWRTALFLPSIPIWLYARILSKKDFSIYCLARCKD